MSPERRLQLLHSWSTLEAREDAWPEAFYRHLFALDPSSQRLFAATDMRRQREKLVTMMRAIVEFDEDAAALVSAAAALARRHAAYGVRDADYDTVTEALMRTLADAMGAALTPELRGVWTEWLLVLTTLMRRAAGRGVDGSLT